MYRILDPDLGFDAQARSFRWDVPEKFNMAQACLFRHAQAKPSATALIDRTKGRKVWTFAELAFETNRFASLLRRSGVVPGDRVAILLPQGAATLIAHFAAYQIGAVALPLFVLFGSSALEYRLSDSAAKVVVTEAGQMEKLDRILPRLDAKPRIFSIDSGAPDFWAAVEGISDVVGTAADDPAVMIYTSGTTGDPKGVLHAHRFLLGHLPCLELGQGGFPLPDEVGWTPADWAWIGGLMDMALPCFFYGVPLVAKRFKKFDAQQAFEVMLEERVSRAFLPPTALKLMQKAPPPENVKLRSISSGGEPLGDDLVAWAFDTFGAEVNELYGQTECNLCIGSARAQGIARAGTLGKAFPGFDVAILGPDGQPCATDEMGQIAVRRGTPAMMLGYWNKPEQTRKKFVGDWMLTGDMGRSDPDGFITFVARDDDVINSAGYRIGPSEVEAALARDPAVVLAAAAGLPDAIKGQVVTGFVTVQGAVPDDLEDRLIARVRAEVSPHVAPQRVHVVKEMPMTTTGKIQRRVLRDTFS